MRHVQTQMLYIQHLVRSGEVKMKKVDSQCQEREIGVAIEEVVTVNQKELILDLMLMI